MAGTPRPQTVSTKQQRIAELAEQMPDVVLTSVSHHIDVGWLEEAVRRTRRDGATGVDGQTAEEYAKDLEGNLQSLLNRAKSGQYRAPPVRRVHIPKGTGESRPLGIPTYEDKVLQRAVVMALEPIYEQDFMPFSFGFRPGRSAHQAIEQLRNGLMEMGGGWVVEVDIRGFFDALDHAQLREILHKRISDGVVLRLIGKWLNAGVLEDGRVERPETGSPQGGVISPLLANIYLHEVFDAWWVAAVQPRVRGRSLAVRYADDIVLAFNSKEDALRVLDVLHKRFARYGLTLHPDKTRLVPFRRPPRDSRDDDLPPGRRPGSFDFLGFTHYWGRSRRGKRVIRQKTAAKRLSRSARVIWQWCKRHRHWPLAEQQARLNRQLRGHYAYFGVTGNIRSLEQLYRHSQRSWHRWLSRRSQRGYITWSSFQQLLRRHPLARPRVVHSVMPALASEAAM